MVSLGLDPGVARWKAQTNSLSYDGYPNFYKFGNTLFIYCDRV